LSQEGSLLIPALADVIMAIAAKMMNAIFISFPFTWATKDLPMRILSMQERLRHGGLLVPERKPAPVFTATQD
jgi:hypothetical protein